MAAVERFSCSDLGESEARQEGFLQNLDSGYECSIMMVGGCLFMCFLRVCVCVCVLMLMMIGVFL